jgi:pimeloyl-ACP methyl ester carboxylesterase
MSIQSDIENKATSFFIRASDGIKLHARIYKSDGSSSAPIVCLPGLTRTHRDFDDLATFFSQQASPKRDVICIDYRGRGNSGWDKNWENYTPFTEIADLIAMLTALNIGEAIFVGTSRGGILTMILAAMRPAFIKAAIMNDIGPEIDHQGLLQLKQGLVSRDKPSDWHQAQEILEKIMGSQFPAFSEREWEAFAKATFKDENGKPVSDTDPNLLNTLDGIDSDTPPPTLWPQFSGLKNVPVLSIRGEYSALFLDDTQEKMKTIHPSMETIVVEGEGHAPALWHETLGKIDYFIKKSI